MAKQDKGYLVPSPASPYELQCFRVYVPKHTWYIGAFWAAYQFFTSWQAWARDPLHRGKLAAALWRTAYEKARAEYNPEGGCEMNITDIRLDPLNPCVLQVEYDGNQIWVDKADLSGCNAGGGNGGVLRYDNGQIQRYDPCSLTWENVGPAFDETTQGTIPEANIYPDTTGACDGAANITAYVMRIDNTIVDAMVGTGNILVSITEAFAYILALIPVTQWLSALLAGFNEADAAVAGVWTDVQAVDVEDELNDLIYINIQPDGTFSDAGKLALHDAIVAKVSDAGSDGEASRWITILNIVDVLGPVGLSRSNKYAGITGADCSGSEWQHVFDFSVSKQAWYLWDGFVGVPSGVYDAGDGWRAAVRLWSGNNQMNLTIRTSFQATTITAIDILYDVETGVDTIGTVPFIQLFKDADSSPFQQFSNLPDGDHDTQQWTGSQSMGMLSIALTAAADAADPAAPGGSALIRKVTLRGTGVNPFN